jgi:hypothetical protein
MPKVIQMRNISERARSALQARATVQEMHLSEFLKRELARLAGRPSMQEWFERAQSEAAMNARRALPQVIRGLRDS